MPEYDICEGLPRSEWELVAWPCCEAILAGIQLHVVKTLGAVADKAAEALDRGARLSDVPDRPDYEGSFLHIGQCARCFKKRR